MKSNVVFAASTALVMSMGLHLGGFMAVPEPRVMIQGGAPAQLARLGNSFADMAQGVSEPTPPEQIDQPVREDDISKPVRDEEISKPVQDEEISEPVQQEEIAKPVVEPSETPPAEITPDDVTPPPPIEQAVIPVAENSLNPVISTPVEPVAPTLEPLDPVKLIPAVTPKTVETVKAKAPVDPPKKPEPPKKPKKPKKPKPKKPKKVKKPKPVKKAKPKPKGGAESAVRGQADGSANATATRSSKAGNRSSRAGNAAVSNYPGKVMRKIQRTRKERAPARGKAVVGFRVSPSGAATSVRIVRSSGSPAVDRIALRHVRRASPFPKPPPGAQRNFTVTITARR